ncbi:dTDP-4-dehydrorhamnose reductase [Methylophilus rhizosphaerae]|uniref:dTDP-4-dehydrorhamnose reductase n=1 Tax=Methylophilus rhizosphaerae TaxID=492660 RepID=A0A1G8Z002_9PROT|nr:dTDP-4-dehydrorhamnose reductase [Methylophilus rhizosphaerae]SDK08361.1 dTDP-4-dehydrorhamnose reductase [Methylophilus rhizosphaerae]
MKLLLTGCHGQLGFELQRSLAPLAEVIAIGREECDLSDAPALRALIQTIRPDGIINPAAYTAVDKAESEIKLARKINTDAPRVMGEEAARCGAFVFHYSTDYVFEGTGTSFYRETDIPHPQNVYGQSKYDGEQALRAACTRSLVMRTSWVVGAHGGNFAKTMLKLASERESLNVVADQYGAPTSAALLADITAQLVGRILQQGDQAFPYGLYHVAASGVTNWHAYARFVIAQAMRAGKSMKTLPEKVQPISTAEYPLPAKRPANSRLDTTLFQHTFNLRLPDWQQGVAHVLQQIL